MALLELHNVSKAFPGVQALSRVSLEVQAGEVHALIGENGAGKSTLIKLLSGVYERDSGTITFDGQEVAFTSPQESQHAGIRTLYQELNLVTQLTVAENIFLGYEPRHRWLPFINWREMRRQARDVLALLDLQIDPEMPVGALSMAEQQMVELAKTLHAQARLLIMDEPTATLSQREVNTLFRVIRLIKERGIAVLYISHRLYEVLEIADRATILRDGHRVITVNTADCTLDQLARLMSGKALVQGFSRPRGPITPGDEVLRVEALTRSPAFEDIAFAIRAGEIVGLAGPIGSGRTALVQALFGFAPAESGTIFLDGKPVHIKSPQEAIALGIGLLPSDRQEQALLLNMTVPENISLAALSQSGPIIDRQSETRQAEEYVHRLRIKVPNIVAKVRHLSGGTQQKIILSRWLIVHSRILIFDEPTRGIDIGAKIEIYRLLMGLAKQGIALLIVSSDNPELARLCDRVLVMRSGRCVVMLEGDQITEEALTRYVVGNTDPP